MNATVTKKPIKKTAAAPKKSASTASASTRSVSSTKSPKPATKSAKTPAKTTPASAKAGAKKTVAKPTAKPETAKASAKSAAPAKSAVKSLAAKKTVDGTAKTAARTPTSSVAAPAEPKSAKSDVRMSNNNDARDFADKMQRTVVSKVSEVATKTMKSTPAPAVANGALLTEEQILKMSDKDYMNSAQLAFFKARLQTLERELLKNADETTEHLRETVLVPDPADRATIEEEHALELRTRDRERKLLKKVQQSLASIESGDYGWCEETGEPIGIPRLLARPTATLSLEAQQRRELKQKLYGD